MKATKKLFAIALAGVMGLSVFATPAFALTQRSSTDGPGGGNIETNYYKITQSDFAIIVDYTWGDLTWTYCDNNTGNDGWIQGSIPDTNNENAPICGDKTHTEYTAIMQGITIPENQDADDLAVDITVQNKSNNPINLAISLNEANNAAGLKIVEKIAGDYGNEPETSITGVSLAQNDTKIYGLYPTASNPTIANNHTTGTVTLTFSQNNDHQEGSIEP